MLYSGPSKDALAYVEWLREDHRFSDILLEGGISHLPLLDPLMRATALAPSEWRKRLEAVNKIDDASNENSNASCILLDVRNGIPLPYLLGMLAWFYLLIGISGQCPMSLSGHPTPTHHASLTNLLIKKREIALTPLEK
ncbi:Rhodanese-like domain-containing protein 8, chloroplastic [Vitis vinifera]|uniref:Rhodanese-like domain-containing protein 8, chloroplastic n=1 Tax=Vitis vinifera TaxID=29760 RepID=A0A438GIR9_VITVI|nr:Rhodanese-like domain-containing protein 8, chloroplastic [Vitis vinifera]